MSSNETRLAQSARTSVKFNLVSAGLAFFLWGGWAYFVNGGAEHQSNDSALTSALTQGIASFLLTLVMVRLVTWFYHRVPGGFLRLILPALLTVFLTGSCLIVAHSVAGTPRIVSTIAPALTVAFLFNLYTTFKLQR